MSTLLEQAIIDANALKEVALKTAQANLIEKYSKEFKETVEKLLEQEEVAAAPTEQPALTDPTAAPLPDVASAGLSADPASTEPIKNVPSSFLDGDDDELITINFDEIKKQLTASLGTPIENPLAAPETEMAPEETPVPPEGEEVQPMMEELELEEDLEEEYDRSGDFDPTGDALSGEGDEEEVVINIGDDEEDEEIQLELEEEETVVDPSVKAAQDSLQTAKAVEATKAGELKANIGKAQANLASAQRSAAARNPQAQTELSSDELSITEEELSELAEQLKVDYDPTRDERGYMGTTAGEKKKLRDLELMAARDEEATKKREEEKKRFKDLQMENKALKLTIDEFKDILVSLKETQEKQSVSSAKLLYTNKALVNTSLNERQKQSIVESISKAKSVQEAKTIYETLQSTVEGNSSSSKSPKSLSEALNRGPSPFMARKPQVSADDSFADRMRLLAGINKN